MSLSLQYRIALRKLLIDEIKQAAQQRGTTQQRIAEQLGIKKQAYCRLMHQNGKLCSVDSLLLYLARLGVGVTLRFNDLNSLPVIDTDNPQGQNAPLLKVG